MFFKKTRVLEYDVGLEHDKTWIQPAKSHIPEWYKSTIRISRNKKSFKDQNFRDCTPFLEAFTTGYVLVLDADILVTQTPDGPWLEWGVDHNLIQVRNPEQNSTLPTPEGYSSVHLVWLTNGCINIPKGYSAIFTHPLNRYDLPFYTLSGVVDDYLMTRGSIPFFLKEGFTGIIPKGTPYMQLFLFKRENWSSKLVDGLFKKSQLNVQRANSIFLGWYKNTVWKKKTYI